MDNSWHLAAMQELFISARSFRHDTRRPITGEAALQVQNQEGRLRVLINNIKALFPLEISSTLHFYRTWLLSSDRSITASVGVFNSDDNGDAVSFFEFTPHNVLDTGLNIGDFDSVAITAELQDRVLNPDMGMIILFGELPQDIGYVPESDSNYGDDWGRWRSQGQKSRGGDQEIDSQKFPRAGRNSPETDQLFIKDDDDEDSASGWFDQESPLSPRFGTNKKNHPAEEDELEDIEDDT